MKVARDQKALADRIKAYLRADHTASKIALMRETVAGSTNPDAMCAQEMLTMADAAGTHQKRKYFLERAWKYASDFAHDSAARGRENSLQARQEKAMQRDADILKTAREILGRRKVSMSRLGELLEARELGKADEIRKKLPGLLGENAKKK